MNTLEPIPRILICGDTEWTETWCIKHYLQRIMLNAQIECIIISRFGNIDTITKDVTNDLGLNLEEYETPEDAIKIGKPNYIIVFNNNFQDDNSNYKDMIKLAQQFDVFCILVYERLNHMVRLMVNQPKGTE